MIPGDRHPRKNLILGMPELMFRVVERGIGSGFGISRLVAFMVGWSTIVTLNSILLAFLVAVSVGLIFGIYPAVKLSIDFAKAPSRNWWQVWSTRRC